MWILQLNPMTANAERVKPVAQAETKEALVAFMERERAPEPYMVGEWRRTFKPVPLEWFNPPDANGNVWYDAPAIVDVGDEASWMKNASEQFQALRGSLMPV